jgi:UDP-glucose 4-epimerase
MAKVLITGASGFIGGYVVEELLSRGHNVVGLDNYSKYGRVTKSYDSHANYKLVEGDARDVDLMAGLLMDCDHLIAGAALIGGISYFHAYASPRQVAKSHLSEFVDGFREFATLAKRRG